MTIRIALRQAENATYTDTTEFLKTLRDVEILATHCDGGEVVNQVWRRRRNKSYREARQVALLLEGIEQRFGIETGFSVDEAEDYDALAYYRDSIADTNHFVKIQLKEVPPTDLGNTTLNEVIASVAKSYRSSPDLTVGIYINQAIPNFQFSEIEVPKLNLGGLWVVFSVSEDQSRWGLLGDLLAGHEYSEFAYPTHSK